MSLQQDLFLQRGKTLPVRFGLFRWSKCLCSTFFSTDNLAKTDFPGEILSHGKLPPCPGRRQCKGLLPSGSASPAGLKEASAEAHALEPYQTCTPAMFSSAWDFQSISPKFSQMLRAEAVPQGTAVCAARQEPSGTRRDLLGTGYALVWPFCSPSHAPCCQDFGFFPPAEGENKARRQLLLQGMPQQEPCWLPRD